jgi:predicted acyltransferase
VLQRIAVCYLVAAGVYHFLMARRDDRWSRSAIAALGAALALGYWALLMLVPPPGGVAADLTPEGNLGAHLDRALLGNHLWKPRWDPEGLLSTIPAISTTLFGLVAGLWLRAGTDRDRTAYGLLAGGAAGVAVGLVWDTAFPINKPIWTSSYAVFTAGAASMFLGACYWVIDARGWRGWTKPFVILGTNAIALYVVSGLLADTLGVIQLTGPGGQPISLARYLYLSVFVPLAAPKNASLLYALANLAVLFVLLAWMYRRRIFLKV